ncbi:hypothetical protein R1sor_000917 [Riccia sorocarpa]|uniref:Reverse transcriptase domain-containing protein n=1 Tax=Riccia sorocarpa TaxID=122646 RepID=A0ABD3GXN8_9MARC
MVRRVWALQKLLARDSKGVIKLIPKTEETSWLKKWRPITLLPTTYKIIAKIIAGRLKDMIPGLVDRQQTGFIAGRDIKENVLSLRLAQEWAAVTGQDAIFVKLDFQKAYDRNPKTALVAWDRIAQRKQDGGLNWSRFRDKAAAMHIKCILGIVEGEETEWAQLARSLILRTMREGSYQRERCQWAVS